MLEERFQSLVEQSADGVLVVDQQGVVLYANRAAQHLLDRPEQELCGRELGDALLAAETARIEIVRRDRRQAVGELRVTPIEWDGEQARLVSLRDMTDQLHVENQRRTVAKMDALARLAGTLTHDLNDLLAIIMTRAELLAEELPADGVAMRHVATILQAAKRGGALTRDLRAFHPRAMPPDEILDPNDVVGKVAAVLRRTLPPRTMVVTDLDPDTGSIRGDRLQLEQALMSLAMNAHEAMPEGGRITIGTQSIDLDEVDGSRPVLGRRGPHVMMWVSDTGRGIDPEIRDRIFEPFFTTKEEERGAGLGLSTVYAITRQHEGAVTFETTHELGTTFRIFCPSCGPRCQPGAPSEIASPGLTVEASSSY